VVTVKKIRSKHKKELEEASTHKSTQTHARDNPASSGKQMWGSDAG